LKEIKFYSLENGVLKILENEEEYSNEVIEMIFHFLAFTNSYFREEDFF